MSAGDRAGPILILNGPNLNLPGTPGPVIEVYLPDRHARPPPRRDSLISQAATGVIAGLGPKGCVLALLFLTSRGWAHTRRALSLAYSASVIDPLALSSSSFLISSATLNPTTLRSSSRAFSAWACWRSAMPPPWVSR